MLDDIRPYTVALESMVVIRTSSRILCCTSATLGLDRRDNYSCIAKGSLLDHPCLSQSMNKTDLDPDFRS